MMDIRLGGAAVSESRQLHPTRRVDASGGGSMSRIEWGRAVEQAAATKRDVWLDPVVGSVSSLGVGPSPSLVLFFQT